MFKLSENENYLRSLVNTTEDYYNKRAYNVDSLNFLNDVLIDKIFWKKQVVTVLRVNRFTPCFMSNLLGYATVSYNIVIVIGYAVENYVEKLILELESGKRSSFYMDFSYEKIWKAIGLDLSLSRANELIYKLIEIDLKGKTQQEIYANLIVQTAIHEAKYFTDRIDRSKQIVNYDREFSAHLTELLHGKSLFVSLCSAISKIEGFYLASDDQKMVGLVKTLWELVFTSEQNSYDKELLLTQINKIYNNYESYYNNQSLPELQLFRTKISYPILAKVRKNRSLAKSF